MNADHVRPRVSGERPADHTLPVACSAPAISILEHVRRQTPVVTDDRLALQAWVERRDPR